jgi:hypothetical protein
MRFWIAALLNCKTTMRLAAAKPSAIGKKRENGQKFLKIPRKKFAETFTN